MTHYNYKVLIQNVKFEKNEELFEAGVCDTELPISCCRQANVNQCFGNVTVEETISDYLKNF